VKVHVITEYSMATGLHPCGRKDPHFATRQPFDVTCALCLKWANDQVSKGNI